MKVNVSSVSRLVAVASVTICAVGIRGASADDASNWTKFRGPDGNGISTETKWNPAALSKDATPVWHANVGAGFSSMAIKGDHLYTMGAKADQEVVYCLNVRDGQTIWTYSYACKQGDHPGPRATPTIDDDNIYTVGSDGTVMCLSAATHDKRWQKNVNNGQQSPKWGYAGSVCIAGDRLILNVGKSGMALDKANGNELWKSTGTAGYATPVVYKSGDRDCVAIFGQNAVYGVALTNGGVLWSYGWETKYDVNAADPIIQGSKMFISSGYERGATLLDISGDKPKKLWESTVMCNHFSTCVLLGDCLYGISGNTGKGTLRCIEFATGNKKWEKELGFGSLIAADNKLIVLNEGGDIFIVGANADGYKEFSSAKNVLPKTCWVSPVLCRGMIFCRNNSGDIVALDVSR